MSDLISREAAIEELGKKIRRTDFDEAFIHWNDIVTTLCFLPTIEERKNGEWMPCSERLPEVNGRYLVTRGLNACGALWNRVYIINYSDLMGLKSGRIWWDGNVGKSDFEQIYDVLAWMPLPKPWKGEKDE